MLVTNSTAMRMAFELASEASKRRPYSLLLWGEQGAGKESLARAVASELHYPFEIFYCQGSKEALEKWLFRSDPIEDEGSPGLAGLPGPHVLYLGGLESAPESVWADLVEFVARRRYLDAGGRIRRSDPEVVLIGGFRTPEGGNVDHMQVLVGAFATRTGVPPLRERRQDIVELAERILAERSESYSFSVGAAAALRSLDFAEGNGDQLRELVNRIADSLVRQPELRLIEPGEVEAAFLRSLVSEATGFNVRDISVSAEDLTRWIDQFPEALRLSATQLLRLCRSRYYCANHHWWQHLRRLHELLAADVVRGHPRAMSLLTERLVLSTLQPPGKSESRALADFTKAAGLPKSVPKLSMPELLSLLRGKVSWLPRDVVLVFVDDWMGSGDQMTGLLKKQAGLLRAVKRECDRSNKSLVVRLLCVACHMAAFELVSHCDVWRELDGRVLVAWMLTARDQAFSNESDIIGEPTQRAALKQFAMKVGAVLLPEHPLGWPPGELLVMFAHDVPNNTLPILWCGDKAGSWRALREGLRA